MTRIAINLSASVISRCMLASLLAMSAAVALPPPPSPEQQTPIALVGGDIHIGNGAFIAGGTVTFDQGHITSVTQSNDAPALANHRVIDVTGQSVYPGFILPDSRLGLAETANVRSTIDASERGDMNPSVRSLIAYNTDSEIIPTLRYNGILLAEVAPRGGVLTGQSSVVQLDAWNWEDAAVAIDSGIHLNWPPRRKQRFNFSTFQVDEIENPNHDKHIQSLESLFEDAASGLASDGANLKLAALAGLFSGEKRLFIHVDAAQDIIDAVLFARGHAIEHVVLVGAGDSWLLTDFLVDQAVQIILESPHRRPERNDEPIDLPYRLPAILTEAGIQIALGYRSTTNARNLGFIAGTAAAYGLDKATALSLITRNTAEILGIGDTVGTLETGKDATLFVSQGDALDMRGNQLTLAFIQGRQIQLEARQQSLYKRYEKRYRESASD